MSTSDQEANAPLTRKHLREIRLTGSTPVITAEQAEAAAAAALKPEAPVERAPEVVVEHTPSVPGVKPLTRRQVRERERIRTESVAVIAHEELSATDDGVDA